MKEKIMKEKKEKKIPVQERQVSKFEERFTHDDVLVILEIAKLAFQDEEMVYKISEKLDIADEHLYDLAHELQCYMNE